MTNREDIGISGGPGVIVVPGGGTHILYALASAAGAIGMLRPMFVESNSGEENAADADDSAGVLECPEARDDEGNGASGTIGILGRGAKISLAGAVPAALDRAPFEALGDSEEPSALPRTNSSAPNSVLQALMPPTRINGMFFKIFLNDCSYIARSSATSAGESFIDLDDSSHMAIRSNLSRLENNIDSCRGATARELSMESAETLLLIQMRALQDGRLHLLVSQQHGGLDTHNRIRPDVLCVEILSRSYIQYQHLEIWLVLVIT